MAWKNPADKLNARIKRTIFLIVRDVQNCVLVLETDVSPKLFFVGFDCSLCFFTSVTIKIQSQCSMSES